MSDDEKSLQDTFAPKSICFGCGPANDQGLRIKSFAEGDEVLCAWSPKPEHHAFPNVMNGGIIGALLDCHCNWTGAHALMKGQGLDHIPSCVTAEYTIKMAKPTPMGPVKLRARAVEVKGSKAVVEGTLEVNGEVTASCRGVFIAVKPGHPAYHRWT